MIIVIESALLPVLLLPLSSFFVLRMLWRIKANSNISDPPPCGVVPENHSTGQSEWFFSVDFSNRFRLIGVLALSFFPHAHLHPHTLPALSLVYFFTFKASHTHTYTTKFSTLQLHWQTRSEGGETEHKTNTK